MNKNKESGIDITKQGREITITKRDGTTGKVFVKLLPLRDIPSFFEKIESIPDLVKLATGISDKEFDDLDDDSQFLIDEEARELNLPLAVRWAERQAGLNDRLLPIAERNLKAQRRLTTS